MRMSRCLARPRSWYANAVVTAVQLRSAPDRGSRCSLRPLTADVIRTKEVISERGTSRVRVQAQPLGGGTTHLEKDSGTRDLQLLGPSCRAPGRDGLA